MTTQAGHMLAQWLVRFNPAEWKTSEAARLRRLVAFTAIGLAFGVAVAWVMGQVLNAGQAFAALTGGWVAWCGIVAAVVWRFVRRLDADPARPARPALAGAAGPDDDGVAFYSYTASGARIPYRRNPDFDTQAFRQYESDIITPETPEWGFPREARDERHREH